MSAETSDDQREALTGAELLISSLGKEYGAFIEPIETAALEKARREGAESFVQGLQEQVYKTGTGIDNVALRHVLVSKAHITAHTLADGDMESIQTDFNETKQKLTESLSALKQGTWAIQYSEFNGTKVWAKVLEQDVDQTFIYVGSATPRLADEARLLPYYDGLPEQHLVLDQLLAAVIHPGYFDDRDGSELSKPTWVIGRDAVLRFAELYPSTELYLGLQEAGVDLAEELPEQYGVIKERLEKEAKFEETLSRHVRQLATMIRSFQDPTQAYIYFGDKNKFGVVLDSLRVASVNAESDSELISLLRERVTTQIEVQQAHIQKAVGAMAAGGFEAAEAHFTK